jgi:hypothetical protein
MPNLDKIKKERLKNEIRIGIRIHPYLIGKSIVIIFSECTISLIRDVLVLLSLNSLVMLSLVESDTRKSASVGT